MTKRTEFIIKESTNDDDLYFILTEHADYMNDTGDLIDSEGMAVPYDKVGEHLDNWVIEDKYFFDYLSFMNAHEDYIKFLEGK